MYLLCDIDMIILTGDVNSRIGNMHDTISDMDSIPPRNSLDMVVNEHGHTFLEFLNDAKMCVLNGRFRDTDDNFTSVSTKGKSVVDYMCVPHDNFSQFESFQVISPSSLVAKYNLHNSIGERSKLPDHYILKCKFRYRSNVHGDTCASNEQSVPAIRPQFNSSKYKLQKIPETFLSSELVRRAFLDLTNQIELSRESIALIPCTVHSVIL